MPMRNQNASAPSSAATIAQSARGGNHAWRFGLGAALLAWAGALALYLRTVAPDVLVGDSGEFQFTGPILGIPHPTGYPLYTLLGKLWSLLPVGPVAYRINLSSAVYMAAAAGILAAIVWRALGWLAPAPEPRAGPLLRALGALAAGGLFAASATVWAQALVARAYALNALLVAAGLAVWLLWWRRGRPGAFWAAALLLGASFAHHGTTITLLPGYALLALAGEWRWRGAAWRARARRWAGGALAFALGLSPYLLFVYRFLVPGPYYWGNPQTWADVLFLARGGPFADQIFGYPLTLDSQLARLGFGVDQIAQQFGAVGVALGLAGLLRLLLDRRTRPAGAGLCALFLGNFIFAVNYRIIGHIYLIPTYLFWCVFMAVALLWPVALAVRLPAASRRPALAALALVLAVVALGVPPALVAARFAHEDRSADTRVRDLALETLAQAETGAHVYVDWESISVLRYYRYVDHRRLDLDLRSDDPNNWAASIGRDLDAGVPVYVGGFAGADPPAAVRRDFILARVGLVYHVLGRAAGAAGPRP
jgi:hypothetical protein